MVRPPGTKPSAKAGFTVSTSGTTRYRKTTTKKEENRLKHSLFRLDSKLYSIMGAKDHKHNNNNKNTVSFLDWCKTISECMSFQQFSEIFIFLVCVYQMDLMKELTRHRL
jgi:hypothetical protein